MVTFAVVQYHFAKSLPDVPPYNDSFGEAMSASLVKDKEFVIHKNWYIPYAELQRVDLEKWNLYVFGYTDYIDKFGGRHRVGYGRFYDFRRDSPDFYTRPDGTKDDQAFKRDDRRH